MRYTELKKSACTTNYHTVVSDRLQCFSVLRTGTNDKKSNIAVQQMWGNADF